MALIRVVKGENSRALPFNQDNKLSTLRVKLQDEGFMTSEDLFSKDGATIAQGDEGKLAVKDVIKDDAITIKSVKPDPGNAPPGKTRITLVKGTDKKVILADLKSKLSDLRAQLQADKSISSEDCFTLDSAEIALKDEVEILVEDVLKKDKDTSTSTITLKSSSGIKPGKTPDAPKTDPVTPKAGDYKLSPTAPADAVKNLDKIIEERGAATTAGLKNYYKLTDQEKQDLLFKKLQLERGLIIQPSGINKSPKNVRRLVGDPIYTMPEFTLNINREMSFSETVHELRKRGVQTAKGSVGAMGIGVSASYSHEKEAFSQNKEEKVYLLATEDVPKVELQFLPEQIQPTSDFVAAVNNVLALSTVGTGKKEQQYLKLLDVLNEYGFFMATKFTVGGQIWAEDNKQVKSQVEAESESTSFGVAFEANLEAFGYPVSASGGYGQLDESKKTDAKSEGTRRIAKRFKGGDPAASGKVEMWIATLGTSDNWDIIKYTELKPTLDLLSQEQRNQCALILNTYSLLPDTRLKTALDVEQYVKLITSGDSDEFK